MLSALLRLSSLSMRDDRRIAGSTLADATVTLPALVFFWLSPAVLPPVLSLSVSLTLLALAAATSKFSSAVPAAVAPVSASPVSALWTKT